MPPKSDPGLHPGPQVGPWLCVVWYSSLPLSFLICRRAHAPSIGMHLADGDNIISEVTLQVGAHVFHTTSVLSPEVSGSEMFQQLSMSSFCAEDSMTPTDKMAAQFRPSHPDRTMFKTRKTELVVWVFTAQRQSLGNIL